MIRHRIELTGELGILEISPHALAAVEESPVNRLLAVVAWLYADNDHQGAPLIIVYECVLL